MHKKKPAGRPSLYKTDAERQAAYRERVKREGGKFVSVELTPEAVQALARLRREWDCNDQDAVERALILCAGMCGG